MDPVSHREGKPCHLRERTLGSLLGELDSEYPPHIVSILELPPGVDTREREPLSLEESFDRRGIVFGRSASSTPRTPALTSRSTISRAPPWPQDPHGFTNSRAAAFAEKVRRTGMNEID